MLDSVEVRPASSVALNVRTFVIIARDFEQGLKVHTVHDCGFDVRAGKCHESRQKAIEVFFDIVTNFFGFIIVENRILSVASAKETTIRQFGEITFDRQAANEAVMWKFGAFLTNMNLFLGDFVGEDKDYFAQISAANPECLWKTPQAANLS